VVLSSHRWDIFTDAQRVQQSVEYLLGCWSILWFRVHEGI
jgi:hypothetical protein